MEEIGIGKEISYKAWKSEIVTLGILGQVPLLISIDILKRISVSKHRYAHFLLCA